MVEVSLPSRVLTLHLKQFRCFTERVFNLDAPLICICGPNGIGKTSLLEALHYACYVRSFRTMSPRELSAHDQDSFFIKLLVRNSASTDHIQVGSYGGKRLIKINQKVVSLHKELVQHYRAISVTEDDLGFIKESPLVRRTFLDQALGLIDTEYVHALRAMRATLEMRNAALHTGQCQAELYFLWTQQLWERSVIVQQKRREFLEKIELEVRKFVSTYFLDAFRITCSYVAKRSADSGVFTDFMVRNPMLQAEELRLRRSLFGAHLDDITITFHGKSSRQFSSRGQQKLIVLLIKAAQIVLLPPSQGPTIMLLDDFMTDLDLDRMKLLLTLLLDLGVQLIFTNPMANSPFEQLAKELCPDTFSLYLD
jgi:DNA replication and repair protein RecF